MQHACFEMDSGRRKRWSSQNTERERSGAIESARDEERGLVRRAASGDHAAFALLYDRFVGKIHKYIYFRIGSLTETEDLTAQVFLRAWEAIGRYQWRDRPFGAWLYRIAHNLIVDYVRHRREGTSLEDATRIPAPVMEMDEYLEVRWTAENIQRAIACLTIEQQQVIILRFIEGYGTEEVAHIMGKRSGAVRTMQHRALLGLRRALVRDAPDLGLMTNED